MVLRGRISQKHTQELAQLQGFQWVRLLALLGVLLVVAYIIGVLYLSFGTVTSPSSRFSSLEREGASSSIPIVRQFFSVQQDYQRWFTLRGTTGEMEMFNGLSEKLMESLLSSSSRGSPSSFSLSVHFSLLRLLFFMLASGRMCLFALLLSLFYGMRRYSVYRSSDILGQTGNGRVFYTGILSRLENLTPEGIPDKQVTGLACPPCVSEVQAKASSLVKLLEEYDAFNGTNLALASVVLALEDYPAYLGKPQGNDQGKLQQVFLGENVPQSTEHILRAALSLHRSYRNGAGEQTTASSVSISSDRALSMQEYTVELQKAFQQVLTPHLRSELTKLSSKEVATALLAFQSGKVLALTQAGGQWMWVSSFPHLSARAVLHAVPAFAKEYDYHQRETIRRALIYSSRSSVFGPARFAVDLVPAARALRQWVELTMTCPHELERIADEIELFELMHEIHGVWKDGFTKGAEKFAEQYPEKVHATQTNLLLVPIEALLDIATKSIPSDRFERLKGLIRSVSSRQQEREEQAQEEEETLSSGIPEYERVYPPFSHQELDELSARHGLDKKQLSHWAVLRVLLHNYGWLARRVGDYTVPNSTVIFAILHGASSHPQKNELGLVGQLGMIALRGARLRERFGKDWHSYFSHATYANMAETQEQYENLMRGIEDKVDDEQ
ncbi:MAG: hypothetical protein KDD55_00350 [Bdellovibrionales bacterium]|nr:hypothetical protein [Bdellovibrionales bacterium]